jgi:hypothetical protein
MSITRINGFRLGIYVFKDAEIIDFAAPYGVFSVACRFDPELDALLIADSILPSDALCPLVVDREGSTAMTPPYGIRPGRMLQVNALASSMLTFGSRTMCARSLVILPVLLPWKPQWNGRPIWCTTRFPK